MKSADEDVAWEATVRQSEFLNATADEVLYGGAAGGGKTDASVVSLLALDEDGAHGFMQPDYRAVVLRAKDKDLDQIYERAKGLWTSICHGRVQFKGQYPRVAQFASGATVTFSGITKDFEDDFQGKAFQRVLWEELCQQKSDKQYRYLLSRTRCAWSDAFVCRTMATANPVGPGRGWVRRRWRIDGAGDASHFIAVLRDEAGTEKGRSRRQFIPARLSDNPWLARTDYEKRMWMLSDAERKALLDGRWDVQTGTFFDQWEPQRHVVKAFVPPASWPRWRAYDYGYARPWCVLWFAMDPDGNIHVYRELYGMARGQPNTGDRATIEEQARRIADAERAELLNGARMELSPADPSIWNVSSPTERREQSIGDVFAACGVHWAKAKDTDNSRISGWMELRRRIRRRALGLPGGVVVHDACQHLIRTLPEMVHDEVTLEDLDSALEDHAVDTCRYGLMRRRLPPEIAREEMQPLLSTVRGQQALAYQ